MKPVSKETLDRSYEGRLVLQLVSIGSGTTVLLEMPANVNVVKVLAIVLKRLYEVVGDVVLISLIRPATRLVPELGECGFNAEYALEKGRLYIVDFVSRSVTVEVKEMKGVLYVSSPSDLTSTAILLTRLLSDVRNAALLIDSLSTLMLFNSPPSILRFLHHLTSKLRTLNMGGVVFLVPSAVEESVVDTLRQFFDIIIKI